MKPGSYEIKMLLHKFLLYLCSLFSGYKLSRDFYALKSIKTCHIICNKYARKTF